MRPEPRLQESARPWLRRRSADMPISESDIVVAYDRMAPAYDLLFGPVLAPGRRRMAEVILLAQPASLLEVGVGTGLMLADYPHSTHVVGVDLSGDMVERARRRARRLEHPDIRIEQTNGQRLDFPDRSFECVTLPYVLSAAPRPAELVREVRRVCKPDGTIVILNHFSGSKGWWFMERLVGAFPEQVGFRSEFRFEEHILAHDWQVLLTEDVNLFGLSKLVVLSNRGRA